MNTGRSNNNRKKASVYMTAPALAVLLCCGLLCCGLLCSCAPTSALPQKHKIEIAGAVDGVVEGASAEDGGIDGGIDVANSPYFFAPDYFSGGITKTLRILKGFETYQQTSERSCGAACMIMIVKHLGGDTLSEDALDKEMDIRYYDDPREDGSYGASTAALVAAFQKRGYKVVNSADTANEQCYSFGAEDEFAKYLADTLAQGAPTMVESLDWGGHWMVIIGYDDMGTQTLLDDVLVFADPYDTTDHYQDGYLTANFEKFYCEWFDACVMRADESIQQYITVYPK